MREDGPLDGLIAAACAFADISRAMLRGTIGTRPEGEVKPDRTLVTALDKGIELRLREEIAARFPDHGIWGEEYGRHNPEAEFQWILDPIDGTAPFIAGIPVYGTLIAVARGGMPIVGIIDLPATEDRWIGATGRQTLHNGSPCKVRACDALDGAMMTVSSPDFFSADEKPALDALRAATHWRIYGGACMSYGLLASGRTDLAFDTKFQIYDYACFRPIVEGAGGVITDWEGRPLTLASGPRILAAGNPERHAEALAIVHKALI